MAKPKFIQISVSEILTTRLRAYCDETGISLSEFIRSAIIKKLDLNGHKSPEPDKK